MQYTAEQILALAPDPSSAKAGQGLSGRGKWVTAGRSAEGQPPAVWGECQGSGSKPYQTSIDLTEPAFKCSCPSRKFPCKHAIGLFLLLAGQQAAVPAAEPPPWVREWLEGRASRAAKAEAKRTGGDSGDSAEAPRADPEAQAKRAAQRLDKVSAGMAELDLWLQDLIRRGLGSAQAQPYRYWEAQAARLIDAQAPGAAREVRSLASLAATGEGWQQRMLSRLGRLHLAAEGFSRVESLPEPEQADLRVQLGFPQRQEELDGRPVLRDLWQVAGLRVEEDERLRTQRVWLLGQQTGRAALVLSFAFGQAALDASLLPGTVIDMDLAFFPSAFPLRAGVRQRYSEPSALASLAGVATVAAALDAYSHALASNPWLFQFPIGLIGCIPARLDGEWALVDAEGAALPLSPSDAPYWRLLAVSGGHPVTVFGEWDGETLLPLSATAQGAYVPL